MMHAHFAILLIAAFTGFSVSAAPEPTSVKMILQWEHQAQFAGYYMAQEKGFYAAENLDVTLIQGGADVHPLELVQTGEAEFCSSMLSSALTQSAPENLTLISQLINRSNLTLIAWKNGRDGNSDINSPTDLADKTVTLWEDFRTPYQHLLRRKLHPAPDYPAILQRFALPQSWKRLPAAPCAITNITRSSNWEIPAEELTVFDLFELGINLPEDGIYCRRAFYQQSPELCDRFGRASMRGWEYAKAHPEETLDVVMRYINDAKIPTNRPHMKWMLSTVLNSIFPEDESDWTAGKLSIEQYQESLKTAEH